MTSHATFYIADPTILGTRLFAQLPQIKAYNGLSEGTTATGVQLTLEKAVLTLNFMPSNAIPQHLQGFTGWVQKVQANTDTLIAVLARISSVRFVIGCVIEPGFDDDGMVQEFLFEFNNRVNGLLFVNNTVFEFDGDPVAGYFYDLANDRN